MKLTDLKLFDLLHSDSGGGVVQFGRDRVVIWDAVALGVLRKEIIETFGYLSARTLFTRLGYAQGWRTAENLKDAVHWDSEREWRRAGARLTQIQGHLLVDTLPDDPTDPNPPFTEAEFRVSWEAEQHLLNVGVSSEPVCWSTIGIASGYLSRVTGAPIYCLEDECVGRGDARCHFVARTRESWGDRFKEVRPFFEGDVLDDALVRASASLEEAHRKLYPVMGQISGQVLAPKGLIARSPAMRNVLGLAGRVARVDSSVLITGPSGAGKERIAQLIHARSPRANGRFVAVNCGAITPTLLESEMFGHAKGAFTGATRSRKGLFEAASGGTVFLDEIAELHLDLQVKLLRVLQEHEIRRVGDNQVRPVDIRVIAATNRDLAEEVAKGRFRQDLYYRLRVVEIRVPPLCERRDDILALARHFLQDTVERLGEGQTRLSPRAAEQLLRYQWPGNVRELMNAIEHAVVIRAGDCIEVEHLPPEIRSGVEFPDKPEQIRPLAEIERDYILRAVAAHDGHRKKAALSLGIGVATLYRKLKEFGLSGPRQEGCRRAS